MSPEQVAEVLDLLQRIQRESGGNLSWALQVRLEETIKELEDIDDAMEAGV